DGRDRKRDPYSDATAAPAAINNFFDFGRRLAAPLCSRQSAFIPSSFNEQAREAEPHASAPMLPCFPPVRFPFARVEYRMQAPDHWAPGDIDQDAIANNSYLSFEYDLHRKPC